MGGLTLFLPPSLDPSAGPCGEGVPGGVHVWRADATPRGRPSYPWEES